MKLPAGRSNMRLLVTGSIGLDTVTTPYGRVENVLGGSAVYFSLAASKYVPVRLVGAVGDDFPSEHRSLLESNGIDLTGLEVRRGSKTFRWQGRFEGDMSQAETVQVQLNVLAERGPTVPSLFADSDAVFLANTHPTLQRELLGQLQAPRLVVCDTMNLWIETERDSLIETLRRVTGVILNDAEARQLTGNMNLVEAGESILEWGPRFVMIKKGEHGSLMTARDFVSALPAFPTRRVLDPTGAGDTFAGAVLGFLSANGRHDAAALHRAMMHGTVAASFTIEGFSVERLKAVTKAELEERVAQYTKMLHLG